MVNVATKNPGGFVISTGQQYSVRDFVNVAAKELTLNITWSGNGKDERGLVDGKVIIKVDKNYFRPTEVETLLGDASKAKKKLGWKPKISFKDLVSEMVREDLKLAESDQLMMKSGYKSKNKFE